MRKTVRMTKPLLLVFCMLAFSSVALAESDEVTQLKEEIARLRAELARLEAKLAALEEQKKEEATSFTPGTRMQPQLNPEISVTGDMVLSFPEGGRSELNARHFELDIRSYLDPFSKMHVVLGWGEHGAHVGEGYISWTGLGPGITLSAGKRRRWFGVLNRWHIHALDQIDLPWVVQEFFGEHGLSGTGLTVEWSLPGPGSSAVNLFADVTDSSNPRAFKGEDWSDPSWLFRGSLYVDLSAASYLEPGLTHLEGEDPLAGGRARYDAFDLVYSWSPPGRELYRGFTARGMIARARHQQDSRDRWGGYLYLQALMGRGWLAGMRFDRLFDWETGQWYWGISPYVTWWESEFVRLRLQGSYKHGPEKVSRALFLQAVFAAGPHKHENY